MVEFLIYEMETKVATDIETSKFNAIINYLKKNKWKLTIEYDDRIFDKGIDFDLYEFSKDEEKILLVWSNWFEGEIKATQKTLNQIEEYFKITFKFGDAEYLKNSNIIEEMKDLLKFKK